MHKYPMYLWVKGHRICSIGAILEILGLTVTEFLAPSGCMMNPKTFHSNPGEEENLNDLLQQCLIAGSISNAAFYSPHGVQMT